MLQGEILSSNSHNLHLSRYKLNAYFMKVILTLLEFILLVLDVYLIAYYISLTISYASFVRWGDLQ